MENRGGSRPGAGRKAWHPSGRGVDVHFHLPPALAKKVRAYAERLRRAEMAKLEKKTQ
jgi:hypothetical protein